MHDLQVSYFNMVGVAGNAIAEAVALLTDTAPKEQWVVGLDTEWNITRGPYSVSTSKTHLVQLAFDIPNHQRLVLLVHIARMGPRVPDELWDLIANKDILKVGKHVSQDVNKLIRDHGPGRGRAGVVELGKMCREKGIVSDGSCSLAVLVAATKRMYLDKMVRDSDWHKAVLDDEQQAYAAFDAYASLEVYQIASAKPNVGARLVPDTALPGLKVEYLVNNRIHAVGTIVSADRIPRFWHGVKVNKNMTLIRVESIQVVSMVLRPQPQTDLPAADPGPYNLGQWFGLAPNNCTILVYVNQLRPHTPGQ